MKAEPHTEAQFDKDTPIYLAGHGGMVGRALHRLLEAEGYRNIITRSHAELDLTDQAAVRTFFRENRIGYVVLAAAKVGGILANHTYPADFIYQNLMIETNVVHEAFCTGVRRLLFLGSSCIYPKHAEQPMKEEALLSGYLEPTNEPYALAKIAGIKLCESYNRQYGTRFRAVMPTNLYGPNDNFDLENSHVLPAMIRKFHLAKLALRGDWKGVLKDEDRFGPIPEDIRGGLEEIAARTTPADPAHGPAVRLWGSGAPRREFLHVDDLAFACLTIMNMPAKEYETLCGVRSPDVEGPRVSHLNVGSGEELPVSELAEIILNVVGYPGDVLWDRTKPDGTPRKRLDVSRLRGCGWRPQRRLEEGIRSTYDWYLEQA